MHATTEQLLSLRDGELLPEVVHTHIEGCEACQREFHRLARVRSELRALPPVEPRQGLWQAVAVESIGQPTGHRFSWASAVGVAASFLIALVIVARMGMDDGGIEPVAEKTVSGDTAGHVTEIVPPAEVTTTEDLMIRSKRLEGLRRAMPQRQVVRAGTARTVADLEDRIALVDMRLNAADTLELTPAQRQALWRERVNLMNSLVRLEYAQVQSQRY